MSQKDDHFFNTFSVVIGGLVALAIVLIFLARSIGYPFEQARIEDDQKMIEVIDARTAPIGRVAQKWRPISKPSCNRPLRAWN